MVKRGVAVLALQGDFEAHRRALDEIGVSSFEAKRPADLLDAEGLILPGGESTTLWKFFEAKRPADLAGAEGLILPGGESTTLWKFFEMEPWEEAFRAFAASGRPILGTCAGAILLAREVENPPQKGLGLLDIAIERNAYGRQLDSFIDEISCPALGDPMPAVFIRAPKIRRVGPGVEILGRRGEEPVLARQGRIVAATFHPELTSDRRLHRALFVPEESARRSA